MSTSRQGAGESTGAASNSDAHSGHAEHARATDAWFADQFVAASHAMWAIAVSITGNRTLAEDIVQESAAIALTKLDEFTPGTNFGAWLGRIVRYTALNHARRVQRSGAASTDPVILDRSPANNNNVAASLITGRGELGGDAGAFDDRVMHALQALDETARSCLLLRTLLNMPYREIAAALDIPEGTAMSHVHRARHAVRTMLEEISPIDDAEDGTDA